MTGDYYLFIIPQERYSLQREHVLILITHLIVVLLPQLINKEEKTYNALAKDKKVTILFVCSEKCLTFAAEIKWITIMNIKKITREEALRRFKHSLEIKREWERKVAERWANEDQQKIAIV